MKTNIFIVLSALLLVGCGQPPEQAREALIQAAELGDLAQVEDLLGDKTPVNSRDFCQWTPLMKAALNGHIETVDHLLLMGADPNLADKGGYTAVMLAASNNHHQIIERLAQNGANLDLIENTEGVTALIWAAKLGHEESVKSLVQLNANTGIRDHSNKAAIDWAWQNEHKNVVKQLALSLAVKGS